MSGPGNIASNPNWRVILLLRFLGGVDLLAFVAVVMPRAWMEAAHSLAGMGAFPDAPIAGYLARSASALYALHGMLLLYMSLDVARHWGLIRFFAIAALFHGLIMLSVDVREEMPVWWTVLEGPTFAVTGLAVIVSQLGGVRKQD